MIISRTPFRISFFGGGTDYPAWYEEHGGAVLATAINKYCYITCRYLPPFFEHDNRVVWSKIENVKTFDEIQHPAARAVLKYLKIKNGVEIHHDADLPARTGLGSSSAFTVGLLNCLFALKGKMISNEKLALEAINVEQNILKENVGSQDQISAAYGGFNVIEFKSKNNFLVDPVVVSSSRLKHLERHLMFFFTGISRTASEIAKEQVKKIPERKNELKTLHQMVFEAMDILNSRTDIIEFGKLLHEGWMLKRELSDKISNDFIDDIYNAARDAGAIGGKISGAGGGGFMLLFAKPENQTKIKEALKNLLYVPIKFESFGSQIIFYQPNGK
jgi:D-glycero-alpha-D-manno-heptose-7-phosphate kinase